MRRIISLIMVLLPILIICGCTQPVSSEDNELKSISGTWRITEFIGTTNIYTDEENENDVVGKTLIIGKDGVYYGGEKVIDEPKINISYATYDEILFTWKTNPEIFGISEGQTIKIIDIIDKNSDDVVSLTVMNNNEMAYYRYSKYYKIVRNNT